MSKPGKAFTAEEEAKARAVSLAFDCPPDAMVRVWATLDAARAETKQARREYRDAMKAVAINAETIGMMQDQRDAARAERDEARAETAAAEARGEARGLDKVLDLMCEHLPDHIIATIRALKKEN